MKRWAIVWMGILYLASACATPPSNNQQTLIAEHDVAGTELAYERTTATIEAARLRTTLDFAGTQVGFARDQNEFLRSTLIARGTDSAFINESLGRIEISALPSPTTRPPDSPAISPSSLNDAATLSITPPADSIAQSRLSNPIITNSVGENGCARVINPILTPQSEAIYVVVTAQNIAAGTQIASRWRQGEQEIAFYDYVPTTDIINECVWFFIDQTDAVFSPGTWSVTLELAGQVVGTPIPFVIEESGN